jgi:hypothetical protein
MNYCLIKDQDTGYGCPRSRLPNHCFVLPAGPFLGLIVAGRQNKEMIEADRPIGRQKGIANPMAGYNHRLTLD